MLKLTFLFLLVARYTHTQATVKLRTCSAILAPTCQPCPTTEPIDLHSYPDISSHQIVMDGHDHSQSHEASKFGKMNIRGGPGKIQAVLKSASDAQEAREAYAKEHAAAKVPEVRGGPGKVEGVLESAGVDGGQDVPEIRGGPGKVEGVLESAGLDCEKKVPEVRGGPGKVEGVLESAGEPTKPEIRGGPGKVEGVLESAGELKKPEIRGGPGKVEGVLESAEGGKELK